MKEIKFPKKTTYFIAYTSKEIFAYGIVEPDQEMVTGQDNLWNTLSKEEWIYKLKNEFNTNPDETD